MLLSQVVVAGVILLILKVNDMGLQDTTYITYIINTN